MDVQPVESARSEVVPSWPGSTTPAEAHQAALLHGATTTGEAARRQLSVRVGLWLDETGWVRQARWRAVDDAALRAYAEAACSLLESGADPRALDGDALRAATADTLPDRDRADLVASAIHAALVLGG
ncbi:MAG TPA: hypothetical protein VF904_07935 [Anaeromyxobacteraceae bacterium]